MRKRYQQLEHTADLALRIYGGDLRELFANAAYAMFRQLADLARLKATQHQHVEVEGSDGESLLVNWLNELLYLHETEGQVYTEFDIQELTTTCLKATVFGAETRDVHLIIKAATYHNLAIRQSKDGYQATVVFDV